MNINKIATRADKLQNSQANKNAVFEMLNNAIDINGRDNDLVLNIDEMAVLYKYFTPNIPAKPKNDVQWVALAKPKNDVRYYLNYIYSDGARIMATDGHRVHIVQNSDYAPGFYDKNMNKCECDGKFPDIDRVIPAIKDRPKYYKFSAMTVSDHDIKAAKEFNQVYDFDDVRLCAKYLKQACSGFSDPTISYLDSTSNILISDGDRLAVVMPMRK